MVRIIEQTVEAMKKNGRRAGGASLEQITDGERERLLKRRYDLSLTLRFGIKTTDQFLRRFFVTTRVSSATASAPA